MKGNDLIEIEYSFQPPIAKPFISLVSALLLANSIKAFISSFLIHLFDSLFSLPKCCPIHFGIYIYRISFAKNFVLFFAAPERVNIESPISHNTIAMYLSHFSNMASSATSLQPLTNAHFYLCNYIKKNGQTQNWNGLKIIRGKKNKMKC